MSAQLAEQAGALGEQRNRYIQRLTQQAEKNSKEQDRLINHLAETLGHYQRRERPPEEGDEEEEGEEYATPA